MNKPHVPHEIMAEVRRRIGALDARIGLLAERRPMCQAGVQGHADEVPTDRVDFIVGSEGGGARTARARSGDRLSACDGFIDSTCRFGRHRMDKP